MCLFFVFCFFYTILDKLRKHHDDLLLQQEINETNERAALHANLAQYWATHQRAEHSRDADLKCDLKGAVSIAVPERQLGPASMQIFQVFISSVCLACITPLVMLQIEIISSHLWTVSLFPLQGDINTKKQKRREQVKVEGDLRAQIEDNEKRRSGEKHRGGEKHSI